MFEAGAVMIEKPSMSAITRAEWQVLEAQRARHDQGLQAATLAMQAGRDEEFVVVCLLHDIGFTCAGPSHGEFSAALLRPYISEQNRWVLEMHQLFGFPHMHDHPDVTIDEHERFRGHPHFAATADFVARFDQNAVDPTIPILPVAAFAPMVHRLFATPPRPRDQTS